MPRLIAHIVHSFDIGGLENGVVNLVNHLPAERWRHAIVSLTGRDALARRLKRDDVRLVNLEHGSGQTLRLFPRLYRLLRQLRPTIVHTRNLATLECQLVAALCRVPVRVHGEHGWDINDLAGENRRASRLRRVMRPFVPHQSALSRATNAYLRDAVGLRADRLTRIPNGVDATAFAPAPAGGARPVPGAPPDFFGSNYFVVGTVGRATEVKNQRMLCDAFEALRRHDPWFRAHARMCVVGGGPLLEPLRERMRALGAADAVWFAGDRNDVADLMRHFDLFAMISLTEGLSNAILEAMACGLPVVATKVGGNDELVLHGRNGTLVSCDDVSALAEAIARYAQAPDERSRQGREARAIVQADFSLDRMVSRYDALYDGLVARCVDHMNRR